MPTREKKTTALYQWARFYIIQRSWYNYQSFYKNTMPFKCWSLLTNLQWRHGVVTYHRYHAPAW